MELTFVCRNTSSACNSAVVMADSRRDTSLFHSSLCSLLLCTHYKSKSKCASIAESLFWWSGILSLIDISSWAGLQSFVGHKRKRVWNFSECWGRLFAGVILVQVWELLAEVASYGQKPANVPLVLDGDETEPEGLALLFAGWFPYNQWAVSHGCVEGPRDVWGGQLIVIRVWPAAFSKPWRGWKWWKRTKMGAAS